MRKDQEILLCNYRYDPLDRLVGCGLSTQENTRRFYLKDRLTTEIQGAIWNSVFQHDDQLLAQRTVENGVVATRVFTTDGQRSVLCGVDASGAHEHVYTPYGHRVASTGLLSLLGFNGERPDPVTGHYLLGNGYRAFNPVLMRFNSPDSMSPFGKGGVNAYGYCGGDPVSRSDPDGHRFFSIVRGIIEDPRRLFRRFSPRTTPDAATTTSTTTTTGAIDSANEIGSMPASSRIISPYNTREIAERTESMWSNVVLSARLQRLGMTLGGAEISTLPAVPTIRPGIGVIYTIGIVLADRTVSQRGLFPYLRNLGPEEMHTIRVNSNTGAIDSRLVGEIAHRTRSR